MKLIKNNQMHEFCKRLVQRFNKPYHNYLASERFRVRVDLAKSKGNKLFYMNSEWLTIEKCYEVLNYIKDNKMEQTT